MNELLEKITLCIERGKADLNSPFPADMQGQEGAAELTQRALQQGISPNRVLGEALITGMHRVGEKFSRGEAFVPDLLIAAKAMNAAMAHIKPFFETGEVRRKGTFVIGTVAGDLHDIGKNIVRMVLEGNGWEVIDLGINVSGEKFLNAIAQHPGCMVGMSSLLTTTMAGMEKTVAEIKAKHPGIRIFIGGAPVTKKFSDKIGADGYFPDPQGLVEHLERIHPR